MPRRSAAETDPLDLFAGDHPTVKNIKENARSYANSDAPVLITGETGTGKELIARAIHKLSRRGENAFVPINCSAFSAHLVESELFGHETGAFTGATVARQGFLRVAHEGTLFLDEIADLPRELQPKILRVLQFGTFYPVGGDTELTVDVRVISATNRDPTFSGKLRKDLLYRLNSLHLHIPPLRERPEDIPLILKKITERRDIKLPTLNPAAADELMCYPFPGNVRELESFIEKLIHHRCLRKHPDTPVTIGTVRELLQRTSSHGEAGCVDGTDHPVTSDSDDAFSLPQYLERIESETITTALSSHGGNISRTARALGISRQRTELWAHSAGTS